LTWQGHRGKVAIEPRQGRQILAGPVCGSQEQPIATRPATAKLGSHEGFDIGEFHEEAVVAEALQAPGKSHGATRKEAIRMLQRQQQTRITPHRPPAGYGHLPEDRRASPDNLPAGHSAQSATARHETAPANAY